MLGDGCFWLLNEITQILSTNWWSFKVATKNCIIAAADLDNY
jgi:hypothetical protein